MDTWNNPTVNCGVIEDLHTHLSDHMVNYKPNYSHPVISDPIPMIHTRMYYTFQMLSICQYILFSPRIICNFMASNNALHMIAFQKPSDFPCCRIKSFSVKYTSYLIETSLNSTIKSICTCCHFLLLDNQFHKFMVHYMFPKHFHTNTILVPPLIKYY